MSIAPRRIPDKHCLVPCPPEFCDCRRVVSPQIEALAEQIENIMKEHREMHHPIWKLDPKAPDLNNIDEGVSYVRSLKRNSQEDLRKLIEISHTCENDVVRALARSTLEVNAIWIIENLLNDINGWKE
jgi:hypothetical protein